MRLLAQEWTQPHLTSLIFHCVCGDGGHHKTTTLITVMLAATAAVVYREVVGKESKIYAQLSHAYIRWRSRLAKGMCSADPECTPHSCCTKSEVQVLIDLTTKSAKNFVAQPPATVSGVGLCSLLFDVSFDPLFTALEMSVFKPWSVRPPAQNRIAQ